LPLIATNEFEVFHIISLEGSYDVEYSASFYWGKANQVVDLLNVIFFFSRTRKLIPNFQNKQFKGKGKLHR